jgi:ankyrin repeat protein
MRSSSSRAHGFESWPTFAKHLVSRGAPLDLERASGVGRLDVVRTFFKEDGTLKPTATRAQMHQGFALACAYGHAGVVDFLLDRGMEVDARLNAHGHGHTGLHVAAFHAHVEIVKSLLLPLGRKRELARVMLRRPIRSVGPDQIRSFPAQ